MSVQEILASGGGTLLVLSILIQISPLKINPWSWIAKSIGNALNRDLLDKVNTLENKITEINDKVENVDTKVNDLSSRVEAIEGQVVDLRVQVNSIDNKVDEVEENNEKRDAILCRARILRFGDEILHGQKHSKDHFDQILLDCTNYKNYCDAHPGFMNNITEHTVELINSTYDKCLRENSFL